MTTCNLLPTEREKRSLECSICLERLRNPKTLPCLHSYCEECLINYAPEGTKSMKCPQCKEQFQVPEGGAVNFKSNYHLKELVEEIALRTEMLEPRVKLMCNCCKREETPSEAIARCLDCNQYLCTSGKAAHRRFSALTEHVVATIDEIRSGKVRPKSIQKQDTMCMKHPRNKAEIFCLTCELPICHVCATLKHKSPDHECVEAAEAMETRRQLVKQSLDELERVKAQFKDVTTKVVAMKLKVMKQTVNLQAQINESHNNLLLRAETEKAALLKEIDDTSEKELNELQKRSESAEAHMTYVTGIKSQAESTIEEASDGNFLSMYDTVKSKIDQLCLKTPDDLEQMDIREFDEVTCVPRLLGNLSIRKPLTSGISQSMSEFDPLNCILAPMVEPEFDQSLNPITHWQPIPVYDPPTNPVTEPMSGFDEQFNSYDQLKGGKREQARRAKNRSWWDFSGQRDGVSVIESARRLQEDDDDWSSVEEDDDDSRSVEPKKGGFGRGRGGGGGRRDGGQVHKDVIRERKMKGGFPGHASGGRVQGGRKGDRCIDDGVQWGHW